MKPVCTLQLLWMYVRQVNSFVLSYKNEKNKKKWKNKATLLRTEIGTN